MSSKRRRNQTRQPANNEQVQETVTDQEETTANPAQQPKAQPTIPPIALGNGKDRIGDILRRVREHRGEDIQSISEYLRIRPSFLIALENSNYENIPADAYVIGFLRTYALHLGLDGKGAIDQYRREMIGRRRAPQLSMPQPMAESRTPTTAIIIAASVICLLLYGLWYGLSTPDREIISEPVAIPSTLDQTEQEVTPSPANEALSATPAGDLLLETTTGASEAVAALEKAEETVPAATAEKMTQPLHLTQAEETKPTEEPKPAETTPHHYGTQTQTRLVLKANQKSWVLITDQKGITLFDRNLMPGETYGVADSTDLRLTTGNAGGLLFILDGTELPRLAATSKIVRNLSLLPEKVKERLAP